MNHSKNPICGICGCDKYLLLFEKNKEIGSFKIVRCKKCGLVYTIPFPDDSIERYEDYPAERYLENKKACTLCFKDILKEILNYKKTGKFLEIGCSVGFLLEMAEKIGFEIQGLELSKKAIEVANILLNNKVKNCLLEAANFSDEYFDVVLMNHVLEHIFDLHGILKETERVLNKDGILFLGLPNFNNIMVKFKKDGWWGLRPREHIWHFEPSTIKKILEMEGFKVIKIKKLKSSLQFIFYMIESIRNKKYYLSKNILRRFVIIFKNIIYYLFNWFFGKIGQGDSMFIIATKNK